MKFFISLSIFILLISLFASFDTSKNKPLFTNSELSQMGFMGFEKVNPNLLIYPFKRFTEEVRLVLFLKSDDQKRYRYKLLDNRFKELVYIINFQKTGFLPENVNRYYGYIGSLRKDFPIVEPEYKDQAKKYLSLLEILRDRNPANSAYWMSIQQAIDSTRSFE